MSLDGRLRGEVSSSSSEVLFVLRVFICTVHLQKNKEPRHVEEGIFYYR